MDGVLSIPMGKSNTWLNGGMPGSWAMVEAGAAAHPHQGKQQTARGSIGRYRHTWLTQPGSVYTLMRNSAESIGAGTSEAVFVTQRNSKVVSTIARFGWQSAAYKGQTGQRRRYSIRRCAARPRDARCMSAIHQTKGLNQQTPSFAYTGVSCMCLVGRAK